ncbi:conserved hypothetical protein [Echinococcus multilocularis]|uniref:Uncharacterized protein n=1 Tax=Echinococcus multilocularis TaxID=6211 RepID=A0A087W1N0_ECHMU|nr:conserved hypothetical protein [Echinococcus multilocularis]
MVLNSTGCLFPESNAQGLRVRQCTPETCDTHVLYSIVSARCLSGVRNASTSSSQSSLPSKIVRTRCMVNRTTEVFYWLPPVQDCFSARSGDTPYFYGSIYTIRQMQQAFLAGKAAAVAVREKPLVSLSVGMSALSVALVLIMLLGVCHRNSSNASTSGSRNGGPTTQRQRQAAARRRARARSRRQNGNYTSIGTQADVEPSDRFFILPRSDPIMHTQTGGVNAGFHDSEALLAQPHELAGQTPATATLEVMAHEGEVEGRYLASTAALTCTDDSRLSCLVVPHIDTLTEYQPPTHPPRIFKGVPTLPAYEDATKRGMYCIIRDSDITAPPSYQYRILDPVDADDEASVGGSAATGDANSANNSDVFPSISSWDFYTYGVHRGSINSMPEFSRIYGPPESPYPGDGSQ